MPDGIIKTAEGRSVSAAGFGGYRIAPEVDEHRRALARALARGINLVDTSSNYTDGGSERLIGRVLADLAAAGRVDRDQVVVVTKAGYLQGSALEESRRRKEKGRPWPELVEYAPDLEHCIHPEFLAHSLTGSLERLGMARVEGFLLHNPEYYLGWAVQAGVEPAQARAEYHRRLAAAFAHLETEADAGRIGWYGVSSNTFPTPADDPEHTSLERLAELAEGVSPNHRFRAVQLPLNLLEPNAAALANQPSGATCLQAARRLGLAVMVNRPLNALDRGGLFRLAASGLSGPAPDEDEVRDLLMELMDSEDLLGTSLLPNLNLAAEEERRAAELLSAAGPLLRSWREISGLEHWRQVESRLAGRLNAVIAFLARRLADSREGLAALDDHLARVRAAFGALHRLFAARADARAREVHGRAAALDPEWAAAPSLSQLAIRAVRSTSGVSSVLVGMRRPEYVDDVLAELARPAAQAPRQETWRALARPGR